MVILDEPFAGLDPVNTELLKRMFVDLRNQGKAVILSTHQMNQVEELCDRLLIMEILLSSVSTRQLLTGKVLGLGVAGLARVTVWVISIPLPLNLASSSSRGFISTIQIPAGFLFLGVVYFILGNSVFAVLSAGVAAISPTVQEAQGLPAIYTLFAIAPFWFFSLLLLFPNNPVWIVLSIFPFTAPVLVMLRLGLTGVPVWQLAVSITVLVSCITGGLLLAARLLRTYILMYRKRPNPGEIIHSFKSG